MTARARGGTAVLVLGVAVALTGSSWHGGGAAARDTTPVAEGSATGGVINVYSFRGRGGGPIRGIVTTSFRENRRRVQVGVSLHGLPVGTDDASRQFVVAAATRPCAQAVDGSDFLVWRTRIAAYPNPAADAFSWGVANSLRPPASARSVRVFDWDDDGQLVREHACASGEATGNRR